jgi:hypothetical protein
MSWAEHKGRMSRMSGDSPHGVDIVEALQAQPERLGAGVDVAFASQQAAQAGHPSGWLPAG